MRVLKARYSAADALLGIWTIALATFIVGTLYLASALLIPLALAVLFTFLLSPLVTRMERWIGRIAAVLVVVTLIFTALGGAGWMLSRQLVDLATKLPEYKGNIIAKIHSFQAPKGGVFSRLSETIEELKQELPGGSAPGASNLPRAAAEAATAVPAAPPPPAPQQGVANDDSTPLEMLKLVVAPLLGPLGRAALVVVLVIFMLLEREDWRSRLIRLIGQG